MSLTHALKLFCLYPFPSFSARKNNTNKTKARHLNFWIPIRGNFRIMAHTSRRIAIPQSFRLPLGLISKNISMLLLEFAQVLSTLSSYCLSRTPRLETSLSASRQQRMDPVTTFKLSPNPLFSAKKATGVYTSASMDNPDTGFGLAVSAEGRGTQPLEIDLPCRFNRPPTVRH